MDVIQKKNKKKKLKPKVKKMTQSKIGTEHNSKVDKTSKNEKTVGDVTSKIKTSKDAKISASKRRKRAIKRHRTKWVEYSKTPTISNGTSDTLQTVKNQNSGTEKQTVPGKKRKSRAKRGKKSPAEPYSKVQTYEALYRNPQEFSSNWKKLSQEINTGKKATLKRKSDGTESLPQAKRQKGGAPVKRSHVKEIPAEKKPEIWFDDVDEDLLETEAHTSTQDKTTKDKTTKDKTTKGKTEEAEVTTTTTESTDKGNSANSLVKERSFEGLTKAVAMDCEMVGVGYEGEDSVLARVSIVNQYGKCIYDKYVKPREHVTDYRTQFSGIRPENLKNAEDFDGVQKDVYEIVKGRILVGHALHNDLKVLYLDHPRKKIRDTSRYRGFRKLFQGKTPSLKKLTNKVLNVSVQKGEHNSVEDAQAAMRLYTMYKVQWEKEIKLKHNKKLLKPVVVTESSS